MQCKDYARNAHIDTLKKKGIWRISGIVQQMNLTQNLIVMEQVNFIYMLHPVG